MCWECDDTKIIILPIIIQIILWIIAQLIYIANNLTYSPIAIIIYLIALTTPQNLYLIDWVRCIRPREDLLISNFFYIIHIGALIVSELTVVLTYIRQNIYIYPILFGFPDTSRHLPDSIIIPFLWKAWLPLLTFWGVLLCTGTDKERKRM